MNLSCFLQTSIHIPQENKHDIDIHLQNLLAKEHLAEPFKLSQPDPHLYEVVSIHYRSQ